MGIGRSVSLSATGADGRVYKCRVISNQLVVGDPELAALIGLALRTQQPVEIGPHPISEVRVADASDLDTLIALVSQVCGLTYRPDYVQPSLESDALVAPEDESAIY